MKKLEQVDGLLCKKGISHVDVMQSTDDKEDIQINPGSGQLKNISDLSYLEDCLCNRCVYVKFAAAIQESQLLGHSTLVEQGACRMELVQGDDSFKLKNAGISYIANVHEKLDHLSAQLEVGADDNFILKVKDKLEHFSIDIDTLL